MQGDCLPYPISPVRRYAMFQAKFSGGVRTVHFKAIASGVGRDQPKVMQQRPAKGDFLIDYLATGEADGKAAENIGLRQ